MLETGRSTAQVDIIRLGKNWRIKFTYNDGEMPHIAITTNKFASYKEAEWALQNAVEKEVARRSGQLPH
jgi:hypothetical protein